VRAPQHSEGDTRRDAMGGLEVFSAGRWVDRARARAEGWTGATNDNLLPCVDLVAWVESDPPPRQWLVPNLIPYGSVTALYGDGGSGKTLLALDLMAAAASRGERTWLGEKVLGWRSLGLFAEDDEPELVRRLKRVAKAKDVPFSAIADVVTAVSGIGMDVTLAGWSPDGHIVPTVTLAALMGLATTKGVALVVIDYAAAVFAGNELDRYQVSEFMRLLNRAARDHDVAILLLGHPSVEGMKGGRGTSGSTAWRNQARSFLHLTVDDVQDDPDSRTLLSLTHTKSNYSASGRSFRLASDGSSFEVQETRERAPKAAKGPRLSAAQKVALHSLQKAIDEGGEPSPGGMIPPSAKVAKVSLWRNYAYQAEISDASDEARKKAFKRATIDLQAKGAIGVCDPYAWIISEGDK